MENFYIYFFLRQILSLIIFISEIPPISKIVIIFLLDFISQYHPFYYGPEIKNSTDRVAILDTIGSIFAYLQIAIIVLENKILKTTQFKILLILIFIHVSKTFNKLEQLHISNSGYGSGSSI